MIERVALAFRLVDPEAPETVGQANGARQEKASPYNHVGDWGHVDFEHRQHVD
ncbi:hypothetical protein GCM10027074_38690 [Streptomyces deserti]